MAGVASTDDAVGGGDSTTAGVPSGVASFGVADEAGMTGVASGEAIVLVAAVSPDIAEAARTGVAASVAMGEAAARPGMPLTGDAPLIGDPMI